MRARVHINMPVGLMGIFKWNLGWLIIVVIVVE